VRAPPKRLDIVDDPVGGRRSAVGGRRSAVGLSASVSLRTELCQSCVPEKVPMLVTVLPPTIAALESRRSSVEA
jgi:hypothetical protein